jgi:hypothetical protein
MMLFISSKYGGRVDSVKLIEAARSVGIRTTTLLNTWNTDNAPGVYSGAHEHVAPYGEHAFCEFLAQEMRLNLYSNSLDWVARLPKPMVKRNIKCMSLGDITDIESERRGILGIKHLEPADDACFMPGVHSRIPRAPRDTKVLVHDEVDWTVKYRFLIVNGRIESFCCFKLSAIFNNPSIHGTNFIGGSITAEAFMKTVLENHNTAPACIIDVGYIKPGVGGSSGGWGVCGTYPVWSSELYGLDPLAFLRALFVSCISV